jgi:hypothetical protein
MAVSAAKIIEQIEELLVNPSVLVLTRERGRIDCGGLEFVLIRCGNFFQLVHPIAAGHLSIAIAPHADPLAMLAPVRAILARERLLLLANKP